MNKPKEHDTSQIEEMLELLKPVQPRRAESTLRGRQQFLTKVQTLRQTVSVSSKPRHIGWTNIFQPRKERLAMQILTSVLLIVTLLFGGAGGTVYASQTSMPNDMLYPVKLWSEDVRMDLSGDITQQLSLLEEFTNRRVMELQDEIDREIPPSQVVLDRLQNQTQTCLQLAADLPEDALTPALLKLHERLMQQVQILQQLNQQDQADGALAQSQEQIRSQIRLVEEGLQNPVTFRQRLNNPNDNAPENVPGILDPDKPAQGENAAEKTPGPGNDNGNQNGNQADTDEPSDDTTGNDQSQGNQNGNQTDTDEPSDDTNGNDQPQGNQNGDQDGDGDGICDEENCPNPDECDGDCDGANCQGTGDCDGSGQTDDAPGTENQYQTGKTEQPGPQAQPTQKPGETQGNKDK